MTNDTPVPHRPPVAEQIPPKSTRLGSGGKICDGGKLGRQ